MFYFAVPVGTVTDILTIERRHFCEQIRLIYPVRATVKLPMAWLQKEISISAKDRGCHLITEELLSKVPEIKSIKLGIAHIFSKRIFYRCHKFS